MQKTILIVEDNDDLRVSLRKILASNNFRVLEASDGAEALEIVEQDRPNLVVLDLKIPKISGETVCVRIKEAHPEIIVIVVTAKTLSSDVVRGLHIGADDYMTKPFVPEELIARIDTRLKSAKTLGSRNKDNQVKLYGHNLRLIVSPPPPKKQGFLLKERWYILTNDFKSQRKEALIIYKHRFEIEETFKDLKHICKLKKFLIKKNLTFKILLMFETLAFWIAFWCRKFTQPTLIQINPKKKRSYFKIWWEIVQRELRQQSLTRIQKVWSG